MTEKTQLYFYLPVLMKSSFWGHKYIKLLENLNFKFPSSHSKSWNFSYKKSSSRLRGEKKVYMQKFVCTRMPATFSPIWIGKEQSLEAEDRKSEELTLIPNFSQSLSVSRCKALGHLSSASVRWS